MSKENVEPLETTEPFVESGGKATNSKMPSWLNKKVVGSAAGAVLALVVIVVIAVVASGGGDGGCFGKILVVGGMVGESLTEWERNSIDSVTLLNPDDGTTDQLTNYPMATHGAAGGLVNTPAGPVPLVCGGWAPDGDYQSDCHKLQKGTWTKNTMGLSKGTSHMAAARVFNNLIMFAGGFDGEKAWKTVFLMAQDGHRTEVEDLPSGFYGRGGACMAILKRTATSTEVGVLGGFNAGYWNSLFRYNCTGNTLTCKKLSPGPEMKKERAYFGCGTLKTDEGGRVLLAIGGEKPTEILNLDTETQTPTWKPLTPDLPEEDRKYGSLVVSENEPTTGYFLPSHKDYIYRVHCPDSGSCQFEKKHTPGYKNPRHPLTMAIPDGYLG